MTLDRVVVGSAGMQADRVRRNAGRERRELVDRVSETARVYHQTQESMNNEDAERTDVAQISSPSRDESQPTSPESDYNAK